MSLTSAIAGWHPVTLTNAALREKGVVTGDGCQWVRGLAIDGRDGNFMLWCTDVGGLFRSLDGGKNWEPANVGFNSRGSAGVAIDPHNPRRAVVVAANSVPHRFNGVYLTTDQAASWKQVLPLYMSGTRDMRRQIAYDPSTYDAEAGFTRVIYWSTLSEDPAHNPAWGETTHHAKFFKSTDGGSSWNELPGGEVVADAILAVHPTKGFVYAGTRGGLKISRDGGTSWSTILEGAITGVSVSAAEPDAVWVSTADAFHRSTDAGRTFSRLPASDTLAKAKAPLRNITVAPSDANRQMLWRQGENYAWDRFYSHDGGVTWTASKVIGEILVPTNERQGLFAFHPKNPDIILAPGGDYPMLSRDGGRTFSFAGNGVNNVMVGGALQFSTTNPEVVFFGSQDYATFLSSDGGSNWTYLEPGGKGWGGYNYGAYASTPETLIAGESESWAGPKLLAVSSDGGRSWKITDLRMSAGASYGAPNNADILFAGNLRTTDRGKSWTRMEDVTAVYTHDPASGALYGIKHGAKDQPSRLVMSKDAGASWDTVLESPEPIVDVAVDGKRSRIFFAAGGRLFVSEKGATTAVDTLIPDQAGAPEVESVAIDPINPDVIYVAGNRNRFASNASAQRSIDGGKTWTNLTRNQALEGGALDGGRESMWVRVHPVTREPWFATNCYGIWKHSPP